MLTISRTIITPKAWLIGCERSGNVRRAFRALGHDAWSCDLTPADDGDPHHIQGDVMEAVKSRQWDGAVFFPPCTYLCLSGLHWNDRVQGRSLLTLQALDFVRALLAANIPRIALENPKGRISTSIRGYDQVIQPYQFGDDASKQTCLWLKNLPRLKTTKRVPGRIVVQGGKRVERWANQTDSGQNRLGPSDDRATIRSETYPGIAAAMALQWGAL